MEDIHLRLAIPFREPHPIDQQVYLQPQQLLRLISRSTIGNKEMHKRFVNTIEKNQYRELHKMVGHDEVIEKLRKHSNLNLPPFIRLLSGRFVTSTASWNPFVFAFVYDHTDVVKYLIDKRHQFNLKLCFQVDSIYDLNEEIVGDMTSQDVQ